MIIRNPATGTVIPPENINLTTMVAVDPETGDVFSIEDILREEFRRSERTTIRQPSGFVEVERADDMLEISYPSINTMAERLVTFLTGGAFLFFALMIGIVGGVRGSAEMAIVSAFLLLFALVAFAVGFFNRTYILFSPTRLQISLRPIPLADTTYDSERIEEFVAETAARAYSLGTGEALYAVYALRDDDVRRYIARSLPEDHALYLTLTLNEHLLNLPELVFEVIDDDAPAEDPLGTEEVVATLETPRAGSAAASAALDRDANDDPDDPDDPSTTGGDIERTDGMPGS